MRRSEGIFTRPFKVMYLRMIHMTETCSNPLTKLMIAMFDGNMYVNIDMLYHNGKISTKVESLKFVLPYSRAGEKVKL